MRKCALFGFILMVAGRASRYSVTEALAWTISGAISFSDEVVEGDFDDDGGRDAGEGVEEVDDAEDSGNCGYKDAGSPIASFSKSSSREMHAFDEGSVLASSIDSDASSKDSTV